MAECQLPKLNTRVRFPSPAPRRRGRHIVRGDFLLKSPLSHFVAAPFQIATAALGCGGRSSQSLDDFFGTHLKIGKYSILNVPCGTLWD